MSSRFAAVLGVAGVLGSLALFAALHVVEPSASLDWTRRTISQYALLSNGWLFDTATLLLAGGSLAVALAVHRAGLVSRPVLVALLLWVVGLVGVVWFQKHQNDTVHRAASLLAFLSLPVGALLSRSRPVALSGVLSLLCCSPILWAFVSEPWTGVRWWRAIPLGGVERLLGLAEVLTVLLLAWWAGRAAPPVTPAPGTMGE